VFRRISTKWTLAVLVAVAVPLIGFSVWVDREVSQPLADDAVRFHLLSTATDLADQLDTALHERMQDLEYLAGIPLVNWHVSGRAEDRETWESTVQDLFDRMVRLSGDYSIVVAVGRDGKVLVTNRLDAESQRASPSTLEVDVSTQPWFAQLMSEGRSAIGFGTLSEIFGVEGDGRPYVGLAVRLESLEEEAPAGGAVIGLMHTDRLQGWVEEFGVRRLGRDGTQITEDLYTSSYAWIWGADADTIVAHPTRHLVGQKVSGLEEGSLLPLVEAARLEPWGMYPDYNFRGVQKKAAFKRLKPVEEGGFGWVVGVGVDYGDIYAPVEAVSRTLLLATMVGLFLAAVLSFFVARRTLQPILELERHTRRIAAGELDARLGSTRQDELGDLARSFDSMTEDLARSRSRLVRAEKDAAWREMARQVAHEIKNPLTPISLSISLLRRARKENSPEADSILERTMDLVARQVDAMRDIASDFHAFAGQHTEPGPVEAGDLMDEVLELTHAWAEKLGVEVVREGDGGCLLADAGELQRALLNLVSNALEALEGVGQGGRLTARVSTEGDRVVILLTDTGPGLDPDQESNLFNPYFTTRSSGTGLGLAIVRRIVGDLGGSVTLKAGPGDIGAEARIELPLHRR
jgi:signal transduction histidine kinase